VRFWDATNLEQMLLRYPMVLVKHGVSNDTRLVAESFLSLAQHSSKVVQAAYGASESAGRDNPALEAASALSELLSIRLRDAETTGKLSRSEFVQSEDDYSWLKLAGVTAQLRQFDRYGLRAILTVLRHVTAAEEIATVVEDGPVTLTIVTNQLISAAGQTLLVEVANWADIEVRIDGTKVIMVARNYDE
jgi:hypothetical protein